MSKRNEIVLLQARQLELRTEMAESDAYAAKCFKTGKKFATEYPEKKTAYDAANTEYNANEATIARLTEEAEFEESVENEEPATEA